MAESDLRSAIITAVDAIDKAAGELSAASVSHIIAPVTATGGSSVTVRTASKDALKSADDKIRAATKALKDAVGKSNNRPAGDPNWANPAPPVTPPPAPAKGGIPGPVAPARSVVGRPLPAPAPAAKPLFSWGKPK